MKELWKETEDVLYEVSSLGRVRRVKDGRGTYSGRTLKGVVERNGYIAVWIRNKQYRLHGLVARTFLGPYPLGKEVNHIDGNKQNNRLDNLEYVTRRENVNHAYKLGLRVPTTGSKNGRAKLSESDVLEIRKLAESKKLNCAQLGRKFGVTGSLVQHIVARMVWKHL